MAQTPADGGGCAPAGVSTANLAICISVPALLGLTHRVKSPVREVRERVHGVCVDAEALRI